ncbi:MAG: hypothetical protein FWG82_03370, partial [Oscillospiraceae bacterium]|nr:hypothetical protein [Oscillospiraceae bacterium]
MEHKTLVKTQREIFLTYWKKLASIFLALVILLSIFGGALDVWALEQAENKPPPKQFINGIIPEELDLGYPQPKMNRTAMPAYWDSREYGWISSVKNQGQNGLCWAFAMYGAVEANMLKNGLGEQDFSELHKAYATSNRSGNNLQGFDREPGDGGNRSYSTAYFMRGTTLSGTVAESQDPYNSNLLPLRNLSITQSKTKNYTVENVLFLSDDTKNESINGVVKDAVMRYGSVGASMYWDGNTTSGTGGSLYYNAAASAYFYNGYNREVNHMVLIVGWNDDYSRDNFS